MMIEREGEGLEVVNTIYTILKEALGNIDKHLPHEVMASKECTKWFYNAVLQLFITVGYDIMHISVDDLTDHVKTIILARGKNLEEDNKTLN